MSILQQAREFIRNNSTRRDFLYKAMPRIGSASFCLYSTKFLVPKQFSLIFGELSITASNFLLFSSLGGHALYIYSRRHLSNARNEYEKYGFPVFVATLFNLGSVLFWCLSKVYLPDSDTLKFTYGLASSAALIYIARAYVHMIDGEN